MRERERERKFSRIECLGEKGQYLYPPDSHKITRNMGRECVKILETRHLIFTPLRLTEVVGPFIVKLEEILLVGLLLSRRFLSFNSHEAGTPYRTACSGQDSQILLPDM